LSLDHEPAPAAEGDDERVRLFVALELPDEVRDGLVHWQSRALRGLDGVRAIARSDLHATLCFLGWRWDAEIDAIRDACGVVAAYGPLELRIGKGTWLPHRRPRVLAVELDDGGSLARAQAALSDVLEAGGWYRPEKRPYLAHVTVARVGHGARAPRRAPPDLPKLGFRATRVSLYRSRLSRAGAHYEVIGSVDLASA
jgi:RNA 2',3'-cyclic 3'-phosphodiesterase